MKLIDASYPIYNGMWSYDPSFPEFKMASLEEKIKNYQKIKFNKNKDH